MNDINRAARCPMTHIGAAQVSRYVNAALKLDLSSRLKLFTCKLFKLSESLASAIADCSMRPV